VHVNRPCTGDNCATVLKCIYMAQPPTITIPLETAEKLAAMARAIIKLVDEGIKSPTTDKPKRRRKAKDQFWAMTDAIRERVAQSGLTDEEIQRLIDEAVEEVRAERAASQATKL
jgi:hypothetical protein